MKIFRNENQVKFYQPEMSLHELKQYISAYELLYDTKAEVLVEGHWLGPINGREFPPFSINPRSPVPIESIGYKYITILVDNELFKVLLSEGQGRNCGADMIILKPAI